jgi:peptidyl-prolyl cis-trans isomerase B (cyclophilin B)
MNKFSVCCLAVLLGSVLGFAQADKKEKVESPKPATASTNEVAVIKTSQGEMVVEFWSDVAPNTVENFKKLARKGFYDGTAFHRIVQGFMIQGGDPNTKDLTKEDAYGQGDPGYKIQAEFNDRPHEVGVLSMARNGDPQERFGGAPRPQFANSAGSQFFICLGRAEHLDKKYTAFGKVTKGLDVLAKIGAIPVTRASTGENSKPTTRVTVESVKIVPASSVK